MQPQFLLAGVLVAAGIVILLVRYLRKLKREKAKIPAGFGAIPENDGLPHAQDYWACYQQLHGAAPSVDNHTWHNVDMDDVYQRVNACMCEAGDILLYQQLRLHPTQAETAHLEELMARLCEEKNRKLLWDVLYRLKQIGRSNYYAVKTFTLTPENLKTPYRNLVRALAALPFLCLLLLPLAAAPALVGLLLCLAANFIVTYLLRSHIATYRAVHPLARLVNQGKKLLPLVAAVHPQQGAHMRECLQVCRKAFLPFLFLTLSDVSEQTGLPDPSAFFLLPIFSYYRLARFVRQETATVTKLFRLIGEVDVACAVASFRESLPFYTKPELTEQRRFAAKALYHPLLEHAVANNVDVQSGVLVTGSNASGKSTFLKSVAANLILAQGTNTCCAKSLCLHPARVLTAMAVSDNIIEGDSYFIAEIKAMKRLVDAAAQPGFCYFFIDEILRGTNTVERIAAAQAFLRYFHQPTLLCFAASHDMELVALTEKDYVQLHFEEEIVDGEVSFSFRLLAGPATTRNALKLLECRGFPERITGAADSAVRHFEANGVWE